MLNRPEIACICGSMRFVKEMRGATRELALAGVIVLAPDKVGETITPEPKTILDVLHRRKIDLADRVLVVNPGGYIGESKRSEIAYAEDTMKPVSFTAPPDHKRSVIRNPLGHRRRPQVRSNRSARKGRRWSFHEADPFGV